MITQKNLSKEYNFGQLKVDQQKEQKKWQIIVLIGCFLLQMLPYCVALNLVGVFAGSDWAVWLQGNSILLNLTFTMGALGAAAVAPSIAAMFGKKINMRFVYAMGVTLTMIGFALLAINAGVFSANDGKIDTALACAVLWIPTILTQIGVMIFSGIGVNNLISRWWAPEKRGVALGIAFSGGSVGNMCLQPLVGFLGNTFGNHIFTYDEMKDWAGCTVVQSPTGTGVLTAGTPPKDLNGYYYSMVDGFKGFKALGDNQYVTYLILAAIGLIAGLAIVMVICRKPLPQLLGFEQTAKGAANPAANKKADEAATLLDTKGYLPYWILPIGFGILQMGTVHANMNGQFIQHAVVVGTKLNYNDMMATGGVIFGLGCFIGNICGGILNDKLGPTKSIALAGSTQVAGILCLLFSITEPNLVYAYFALVGISVYVYTSTPAFICGRLYGASQSNNHMAIYGIFIAVAFAIVNSITGVITGESTAANTVKFLGKDMHGNWSAVMIFAAVCMAVGTAIVVTCCYIITKKGIKGIKEYSPTKYSRIIFFKFSSLVNLSASKIIRSKKDFRNNPARQEKIAKKNEVTEFHNVKEEYFDHANEVLAKSKLNAAQKKLISSLYFYGYMTSEVAEGISKGATKDLDALVKLGLVKSKPILNQNLYQLTKVQFNPLKHSETANFDKDVTLFYEETTNDLATINERLAKAQWKIRKQIKKVTAQKEAALKDYDKITKQSTMSAELVKKYEDKRTAKMAQLVEKNATDWKQYKVDYELAERIDESAAKAHAIEDKFNKKLTGLQTKLGVKAYTSNYSKIHQVEGIKLLLDYYNDVYGTYDKLINEYIINYYWRKTNPIENKIDALNAKIVKIQAKSKDAKDAETAQKLTNKISKINASIEKKQAKLAHIKEIENSIVSQFATK